MAGGGDASEIVSPPIHGEALGAALDADEALLVDGDDVAGLVPTPPLAAKTTNRPVDNRLAARVEGKSSLARLGLGVHVTAPTIHAGFVGTIQLEIINHGPMHIKLRAGMPICQLIFETTKGMPETAYKGQFSGQRAK